ncbi:hypothetical protein F8M41_004162 [Gigaspora margarita]|uniref:Uncharacterized protein n=1 Tax=Gigaspora margarita TaxID=4874 RepID=A0A8H4A5W8_GIGMA|nr:hypothetical protein F8M41_004162 [Gigaspora margarita]
MFFNVLDNFLFVPLITSELMIYFYFIIACLFIFWHKTNSASKIETKKIDKIRNDINEIRNDINEIRNDITEIRNDITEMRNDINKIRGTSKTENEKVEKAISDLKNNINRIHETSKTKNKRIEKTISDLCNNINRTREISKNENERTGKTIFELSNNINRIRETSQSKNKRIEKSILNLSNDINSIHEAFQIEKEKIKRARSDFISNLINGINEAESKYIETFWKDIRSLIDKKSRSERRPYLSIFTELASKISLSQQTVYNFYHRRTNPQEFTINKLKNWVIYRAANQYVPD